MIHGFRINRVNMKNDTFFLHRSRLTSIYFSAPRFGTTSTDDRALICWSHDGQSSCERVQALVHGGCEWTGVCMIGLDRHADEHAKLALWALILRYKTCLWYDFVSSMPGHATTCVCMSCTPKQIKESASGAFVTHLRDTRRRQQHQWFV
jgi:hypothetical protein